jgi:hypothetical protein
LGRRSQQQQGRHQKTSAHPWYLPEIFGKASGWSAAPQWG